VGKVPGCGTLCKATKLFVFINTWLADVTVVLLRQMPGPLPWQELMFWPAVLLACGDLLEKGCRCGGGGGSTVPVCVYVDVDMLVDVHKVAVWIWTLVSESTALQCSKLDFLLFFFWPAATLGALRVCAPARQKLAHMHIRSSSNLLGWLRCFLFWVRHCACQRSKPLCPSQSGLKLHMATCA
jgi:hypothetical protein